MGLLNSVLAASVEHMPKALVRKVALKYVAGERLEDAVTEIRRLNAEGCVATVDLLGESIQSREAAIASADTYLDVIETVRREGLDANVSIKPTHFGLSIDPALFLENARRVLGRARDHDMFVRIDMEDSPWTSATLAAYRQLRAEGLDNTGVVLQAMLRRTPQDLQDLLELSPSVRLCKGVYHEPAAVAFQEREEVREAYRGLLQLGLGDPRVRLAIATHDDPLVEAAEAVLASTGREVYEFQMLLGVKPELRAELVKRGHKVRVYVPFGADWYAYSIRRLKENPKFASYITLDVLRDPGRFLGDEGR